MACPDCGQMTPKSAIMVDEYRTFMRLTQSFSAIADLSLVHMGGHLKQYERLSARLADGLSHLYMAFAVMQCFESSKASSDTLARLACQTCLFQAQEALFAFFDNYPHRFLAHSMRLKLFSMGTHYQQT